MSRPTVSAAVLAYGEEAHVGPCLRSLAWADELIVLDGLGEGRVPELARTAGATVHFRPFDNYGAQRQALIELTSGDWVLFVDVDERVPAGLAAEVRATVARSGPGAPSGYRVPRRNYIWGRWIRGGGWWPDAQLRLLRRDRVGYRAGDYVHEVAEVAGEVGTLRCALVHYNYETLGQFLAKQRKYAALEAAARRRAGEHGKPKRLVSMPLREAKRRYLDLDGRRDGAYGAALALLTGWAKGDAEARLLLG